MRHVKALFGVVLALSLAACSSQRFTLNPFGKKPETIQVRQGVETLAADSRLMRPLVWGSFVAPIEGAFFKPVLASDSRNAVVYVYRPRTDWNDQEIQSPAFFLNGKFLSGLKSGSYFWFEIPASTYYFSAKRPLAFVYLTTIFETNVNFEGGKSYFFRYDEERPGPKKAAKGAPLVVVGPLQQMPDSQGQLEIAQTRSMGPGSVLLSDPQPQWAPFDFYADAQPVPTSRLDVESAIPRMLKDPGTETMAQRRPVNEFGDEPEPEPAADRKPARRWWNIASWK
jgi:hypothetical protein